MRNKILRESQGGTITATYAYSNGLLRKDGEFPLFDGAGHERTVTNSGQTLTGTVNYDAYGNTVGSTGSSASPYMYGANSGYRNDGDAGLSYVAARYYDSKIGRFTTRDTYLNQKPYQYCQNDPVNCLDPSGHGPTRRFWNYVIGIGGAIGTGLGLAVAIVLVPVGAPVWVVPAIILGGALLIGTCIATPIVNDDGGPWFTGQPIGLVPGIHAFDRRCLM